jgi:carbon-monoxide dehydrogenase medium subunit
VIVHAASAEEHLIGRKLDENSAREAAELAVEAARPISDVRGSAGYRNAMIRVTTQRALLALAQKQERKGFPEQPVLLQGGKEFQNPNENAFSSYRFDEPIVTQINGKEYRLVGGQHKTLLHLLREDAGLIGSKEGCAEGECGACTVFLDGMAVMACLVPAPRAHGGIITTIEGLAQDGHLHPVQQAFIQEGAVQCGYCTPGFIMSAVKLLEERPHPDQDAIRQAITGNLCRCTGYYKIIDAIERAAGEVHKSAS